MLPKITSNEELFLVILKNKELYGKQICQAIFDASHGSRELKVGSLYPTLHILEQKGLVASRWGDERADQRGGARRRYYRLTDDGVAALLQMEKFYADLESWQPALAHGDTQTNDLCSHTNPSIPSDLIIMSQSSDSQILSFQTLEFMDDYGLDPYAFRIFLHILRHHGETGAGCSDPIDAIASKCDISVKRVYTALKTLTDYRLVSKEPRIGNPSIYHPNPPEEWANFRIGLTITL